MATTAAPPGAAAWRTEGDAIVVTPAAGSDTARRFPNGSFAVAPLGSTEFQRVGGDELLFADGQSPGTAICMYRHRPRPGGRIADSRAVW